MVTESVSESTYRPNYFPLPLSHTPTERDEVLDNLIGVLNTTLTHPDEALQLIARKALDEVHRVQEQARRKLADQQAGLSARRFELLIYEIACVLRIDPDKLKSRCRTQHVAFQRQIAMYLLRCVSGASFPTIGEHFHRNHSTVIYAVALIERRMQHDAAFRQSVEEIEAQITRPTTTIDRFDCRIAGAESDLHGARDIGTINSHRHFYQHKAASCASIEKLRGRLNSPSTEAAA